MSIVSAILLFGFLIFIHELGHFIVAKVSGVKVLKFSLGFGPKVIGKKRGETEYILSAIPLGGYVKMLGEDDDSEIDQSEMHRSFQNHPVGKRFLIILAGPLFNFLTAVVVFFFILVIGMPTFLPVIGDVMTGTPAEKAQLRKGDRVVAINGSHIRQWSDMTAKIYESPEKKLIFTIKRDAQEIAVPITPEKKTTRDIFGEGKEIGLIGVKPSGETFIIREDPFSGAGNAFVKTGEITVLTIVGIVKIIQRIIPADTIGGPVLIFQMAEKQATAGALNFFTFAAVISINLAVLNLLPIPILDGGHILFLSIEAIRKKPLSEKTVMIAQRVGMSLLLLLMAFAMYNDIFRLFSGKPLP
jgi:regulator of sigma E protease